MMELIKRMIGDKREYKKQLARAETLPEDYRFVFEKIQSYLWSFATGDGSEMLKLQDSLLELFEAGAADGKHVLTITGEDVVGFCDDLLQGTRTYVESQREKLNREVLAKLSSSSISTGKQNH